MWRKRGGRGGSAAGRGRGWRSGDGDSTRGRSAHGGSAPRARRVCQYFLAGRCTYGASCKFSHDEQDVARDEATSPGTTGVEGMQAREDYIDFRRQVRQFGTSIGDFTHSDCHDVWTLAIRIMNASNRELQQSVARDLADDEIGGTAFVARTVRRCAAIQADEGRLSFFRPFLEAITHPSLLRCLSVDTFVGTIYRIIGGIDGDQGLGLFAHLNQCLLETSESRGTTLALIVSSLYELLIRVRKSLLHEDLPELLDALNIKARRFASLVEDPATLSPDLDATLIRIDMMRRMMEGARGRLSGTLPTETTDTKNAHSFHSTFPMEVVVPGGKHDNDFADMTKIQIFPTLGEITSDMSEYLPTTDLTQPHFLADPVQRHLDSAFRLLRHDIFGPLKEVIGAVLAQPNLATTASSSRFIDGNIRAHTYHKASISHVLVDGGFQAVLSFAQPPQLRRYSLADRRRWWEDSSRLEQGNLVCFVSTLGDEKSFLLFVVTKKTTKNDLQDQNQSFDLVSERFNPAVTAKLASETQANLAMLTQMYAEKQEGLLIELPGLIPETFVPILDNLQEMMRDGDLAFRRWILPPSDSDHGPVFTNISPPAYARQPGFRFRLDSITQTGRASLSLDPAAPDDSVNPETLEAATGLDRGQSQSLIAALTREYALIQGPPGTGKSYVGVQLVRVLLDHKVEATLGPILVM